jgi:hypothetical protein
VHPLEKQDVPFHCEVIREDPQTDNGSQQVTPEREMILTWICNKTWEMYRVFTNNKE